MADQAANPMADLLNMSGMAGISGPNPYLQYTGQIPMAGYRGTPTDAMGRSIQSYLDAQKAHDAWQPPVGSPSGTTLNSQTAAPAGRTIADMVNSMAYQKGPAETLSQASNSVSSQMDQLAAWQALTQPEMAARGNTYGDAYLNSISQGYGGRGQAAAPASAAPANPIDMRQAYLDALANPGPVTTPGATIQPPPAATGSPQPSVLQSFLASHGPQTGAGGYSTKGLFDTLKGVA